MESVLASTTELDSNYQQDNSQVRNKSHSAGSRSKAEKKNKPKDWSQVPH